MNPVAKNPSKTPPSVERFFSIEEYYIREEKSLHKHEYHNGKIILIAGAKFRQNHLAHLSAFLMESFIQNNNLNFTVNNSETKIRIEKFNKIVYPDALVICKKPHFYEDREDTITNPLLVVEVLSSSTSNHDRTTKFEMYRSLSSFREYVLVYQDREHVIVWTKQNDGAWLPNDYIGLEAVAILKTIRNCPLELAKLYKDL